MDLEGKVAIVTGAASAGGLGFATARMLVQSGAAVLLTDIDGEGVAARSGELQGNRLRASSLAHDVTDAEQWSRVVAAAVDWFGGVDILARVAGSFNPS